MQYHHRYPKTTALFKMIGFSARSARTGLLGLEHRGRRKNSREKGSSAFLAAACGQIFFVSVMKLELKIFSYLDVHSEKENLQLNLEEQLQECVLGGLTWDAVCIHVLESSRSEEVLLLCMMLVIPLLECCIQLLTVQSSKWMLKLKTVQSEPQYDLCLETLPYSEKQLNLPY